jgi:glucokinase
MAFLGIEIGGTKLQAAVVDDRGRVLLERADAVQPADGAAGVLRALEPQIMVLRAPAATAAERITIDAVGVGFGGPVDRAAGVVAASFHVSGWGGFPLAEWIAERAGGVPVVLENDSNAAALAEAVLGAGRGANPVLYSNVGSGIGAGLVIDGRIYHGHPPGEVEIGHLRMNPDGTILEDLASGWSIDRQVRDHAAAHPDAPLARIAAAAGLTPSARHLAAAIAAGDAAAGAMLDTAARHYAFALSHAVHLLHPQVIVLGGGVAGIGEPWRGAVARHLPGFLMEPFRPGPDVRLSTLGRLVVPVGAAVAAARLREASTGPANELHRG